MEREGGNETVETPWRRRGHRLGSDVQILIGIGSLLALLAIAVALSVILILSFENDATDDAHGHVLYAAAIQEASFRAQSVTNDHRGFLLSGRLEFLDEIETGTAAARSAFAVAIRNAREPEHRRRATASRAGFEHWLVALHQNIATYRTGAREQAIADSLGRTRQLRIAYEQSLADAYALGSRSIDSATEALSSSASRAVTALLAYLAVALVLGIGVALWVIRAILRPAFTLSENAIELLTQGRVLVDEDEHGSHHGIYVVVPIEVVNALAGSALDTREALRPGTAPR